MNILDVWFDSGSSHEAVLSVRPELTWPADIYLEGSDQHRGWFQSSLLVGLGTRGRPPFREVVTHGFIVADDGRKMSKSLGNSIEPQDIIKQSGADILRLWVSMSDYTQEIRLSKEILARVVEAYRKIRNTLRYLLANLYDFDPAVDLVDRRPPRGGRPLHPGALRRGRPSASCARTRSYDYGTIFQALNAFATRRPERVLRRRLEGSALHVRGAVARAPVGADGDVPDGRRPDAADGADPVVHRRRAVAVSSRTPRGVGPHGAVSRARGARWRSPTPTLLERWTRLIGVREQVLAEIEPLRKDKQIGSSLQAKVVLSATDGGARACSSATRAICRCCSSCRRSSCDRAGDVERRDDRPSRDDRARERREVRALLALRADGLERTGMGRPVRALPGRAGGDRQWVRPDQPAARRRARDLAAAR